MRNRPGVKIGQMTNRQKQKSESEASREHAMLIQKGYEGEVTLLKERLNGY